MLKGESNLEYQNRIEFFNFLKDQKIKNADNISKIWANLKFRKCFYSPKMYGFIMKLDKNFNNKN